MTNTTNLWQSASSYRRNLSTNKELLRVRTELNNIKSKGLPDDKPMKAIRGQLSELETRVNSTVHNILIATQRLEGISENIKQLKELLKA